MSGIKTPGGDVRHLFVEGKNYNGCFLPQFVPWNPEVFGYLLIKSLILFI